mgnify:CR=1 FL=1
MRYEKPYQNTLFFAYKQLGEEKVNGATSLFSPLDSHLLMNTCSKINSLLHKKGNITTALNEYQRVLSIGLQAPESNQHLIEVIHNIIAQLVQEEKSMYEAPINVATNSAIIESHTVRS